MSQSFRCGDPEALVSYLYEEDSPAERRAAQAHLATCDACASEIEALGDSRVQLRDWAPPPAESFNFQVTRRPLAPAVSAASDAEVARAFAATQASPAYAPASLPSAGAVSARAVLAGTVSAGTVSAGTVSAGTVSAGTVPWWQQPMPAWMQAAAAVAVFGAGLAVGAQRAAVPPSSVAAAVVTPPAAQAAAGATGGQAVPVSSVELAKLEERLRQEIAQLRATHTASAPATVARRTEPDDATLSRVQALIGESEERQRRELALRTAQVVRDIDAQRRDDLARVQATMGQIEGSTGAELRQQNRELWNFLMNNVSQRGTVR
jgi:hypothetical protein